MEKATLDSLGERVHVSSVCVCVCVCKREREGGGGADLA